MQNENFTLSDLYGAWLKIEIQLKSIQATHTNLVDNLSKSFDKYKGQLFLNPLMVAAAYLDPRFTRTLSIANRNSISKLLELYKRLKNMESENQQENTEPNPHDAHELHDDLDAFLAAKLASLNIVIII